MSVERAAWYKRPGLAERAHSLIDQHLNTNHAIWTLARIIHEGSSRNGGVARDKRIRDTRYPESRIPNFESRLSRFSRPSRLSQVPAQHSLHPHRRTAAIQSESGLPLTLHGTLYEITNFTSFVQTHVLESRRPDPDSVRPIKNGWIRLCRGEGTHSGFPLPPPCRTDDTGRFELDLSQVSDAPVFVVVGGSEKLQENYWYRSACVRPGALGQHALEIYLARAAISDESGFSQADLAGLLEQTKKQVADLERISGTITPDGIALHCVGKGGKASGRLVLKPDQSGDLKTILHHSVEDFRLELPGPSWLVGLLVSRDAIEMSIRTGLRNLAQEIDARLRLRAIALFTNQVQTTDPTISARLASMATLTLEHLRYPVVAGQGGASGGDRAIAGDVCLGFPQTFQGEDSRKQRKSGVNPSAETVWNEHTWWFNGWCSSLRDHMSTPSANCRRGRGVCERHVRVVLDTNIIVSGLMSMTSPPAQIL